MMILELASGSSPQKNPLNNVITPLQLAFVLIETTLVVSLFVLLCRPQKSLDVYVNYCEEGSGSELSTNDSELPLGFAPILASMSETISYDLEK